MSTFMSSVFRRCFNPRSPRGGATLSLLAAPKGGKFQSTLPTRGSDIATGAGGLANVRFNPRSPRGGATTRINKHRRSTNSFNPRSPRGGATSARCTSRKRLCRFNPRSPRGGATVTQRSLFIVPMFQSTLPTRGSDGSPASFRHTAYGFQSTLPTRGSDAAFAHLLALQFAVSIHAPHEGERLDFAVVARAQNQVSIHAPHEGERRWQRQPQISQYQFQSTLPTRESDCLASSDGIRGRPCFNPRSPRGGATGLLARRVDMGRVSIHAPHEGERRRAARVRAYCPPVSIHAPHEGERRNGIFQSFARLVVSIHAPHEGERRLLARRVDMGRRFNPRSPRGGATT